MAEKAWERQKGESSKAFDAFTIYLYMDAENRSVKRVAEECHKCVTTYNRWSQKWKWRERVRGYDSDNAKKAKAAAEKEIKDMVARHIRLAGELQTKAILALSGLPVAEMTARDIKDFIREGTALERLSRGEPTERIDGKSQISGGIKVENPFDGLTTEELRRLIEATGDGSEDGQRGY